MILDKNVTLTEVFITDIYALVTARQRSEIEVMEADCKKKSHAEHTKPAAKNDLITDCINCLPNGRKRMSIGTFIFDVVTKDLCLHDNNCHERVPH